MTQTPAALGIEAAKQDDAERTYQTAFYAHSVARSMFRAGKLSAEEFCISNETLISARIAHEAFLFGGTDNECHY